MQLEKHPTDEEKQRHVKRIDIQPHPWVMMKQVGVNHQEGTEDLGTVDGVIARFGGLHGSDY